ncbi:hypothetical protein D3C84_200480 [compost metagenome]
MGGSYLGRFWLQGESENNSAPGTVEFSDEGAVIDVEWPYPGHSPIQNSVLFGRLSERGQVVAFFNAFTVRVSGIGGDGPELARIEATYSIFDRDTECLLFDGVEYGVSGCERWFNDEVFSVNNDTGAGVVTVSYPVYQEEIIDIDEELCLKKIYRAGYILGGWGQTDLQLRRVLRFRMTSRKSLHYSEWIAHTSHYRNLIEFLSQATCEVTDVQMLSLSQGEGSVHRVHRSRFFEREKKKFDWCHQLLDSNFAADDFSRIVRRWFQLKCQMPEPFERYFSAFCRPGGDPVLYFMWLIAAFEEIHKFRCGRNKMDLLSRLREVYDRWGVISTNPDAEASLERVRDTRNYYAHGAGDIRAKAAGDIELLRLGCFLHAILNMEMLSLLEFSDDRVIEIARSSYWMVDSISLAMYPGSIK